MENKKEVYSWVLYDWANSAFATTILAVVLPIFYKDFAAANLADTAATSYWGYTQTVAMLIIAILAPILGAMADYSGSQKSFLKSFVVLGVSGTALLFLIQQGNYILASFFFIIANIGFAGGNIFYDSFLPIIAPDKKLDYISGMGYAAGYLGGGLLLAVNLIMISKPELFGITEVLATKFSFISVALWWLLFSLPAFYYLPQGIKKGPDLNKVQYVKQGFVQLKETLKNVSQYPELWKFLLAFWIYNDGIGTIIRMATIYGREIGIGRTDLIGAMLLTQFIGIPCALAFGKLGEKIGPKKGIIIALTVYLLITIRGYFLSTALDFWILAALVGLVQGGAQALSRSLYGSMVPPDKTSEFYSFFGISSKFAAITGPLVFGLVGQITDSSRLGVLAIALFFLLGIIILSTVDVEKGRKEGANAY
ncbi:MAG: MFS transporter [Bacillota bacterium]